MRRLSSLRLDDYDYSEEGIYFMTICTQDHKNFFGRIENWKMVLNDVGKIAEKYWKEIPKHYENVQLGAFVIMPNHIHGLIEITNSVRTEQCSVPTKKNYGLISKIIKSFKNTVTKQIRTFFPDFAWHRSFYDHIVRNDKELEKIHEYIIFNPEKWELDKYFSPK